LKSLKLDEKPYVSSRASLIATGSAYILSPLIILFIIQLAGLDTGRALAALYAGSIGSTYGIALSLLNATHLLIIGLGIVIAFRCRLFNVGAEGQQIVAAIFATGVGLAMSGMNGILIMVVLMVVAAIAGALYGGLAGILKARWGINEIIVTIMLNWVAVVAVSFVIRGPLKDPTVNWPQSPLIPFNSWLPFLIPGSNLNLSLVFAFAMVAAVYVLLFRTPLGYEIRATGANINAARANGINVSRIMTVSMLLSGALAGLSGGLYILGVIHQLLDVRSSGSTPPWSWGYTGIVVALMGRLHPVGVIFSSIFFGALLSGMGAVARELSVPAPLVDLSQGIVIILVLMLEAVVRYRVRWS
jgi:simple sugar transport system permease protein